MKNRKRIFKRMLGTLSAAVLCCNMSIGAFAATTDLGTTWYGDELSVDITAGTNGYTFRSVYPYSSTFKHGAYEMSNHMVSANGGEHNDIPQTFVMVDASEDYTWIPDGLYSFGESNYEVLYCCDAETEYEDGIYYMRKNLEDSEYYSDEDAAHIRAIVTNSYPYVSLEEMKSDLDEAGFEDADKLTRAEIITAVQAAIWAYANNEVGEYVYSQTFHVPDNLQWGGALHDFTDEMTVWWNSGYRKFSTDDEVADRIDSLIEYLKGLDAVYAEKNQIIISDIQIVDSELIQDKEDVYNVDLQVVLNNSGSGEKDDITLDVYVDDSLVESEKIVFGTEDYSMTVEAKIGQTIKAVVSGTQDLPKGVYFYEPQGGRDVSQCLVGVAAGKTDVYAEAQVLVGECIINLTKTTTTEQGIKALEGIVFDIYYAGTVDQYTEFVKIYTSENKAELDAQDAFEEAMAAQVTAGNLACVETVTTDILGNATYNVTTDGQPDGIYLIIEREHPAIVEPLDPFIVAVPMTNVDGSGLIYEVNISPKNEVLPGPEVIKNVTEIGTDLDSFAVGETHTWILRGGVPADIANGKSYVMTDVLDECLDYQGNVKVVVGTADALAGTETITLTEGEDYTLTVGTVADEAGEQVDMFTVTLETEGMTKVAEAVFKLAKVVTQDTEGASPLVTKEGTKYVVYEEFYTAVDAETGELSGKNTSVTTTADGKAMIYGLKEGTYYLVETQAPKGYNLLSYPVEVTLNEESHAAGNVIEVANSNQFRLPETGGMGTNAFTAGGMVMLAAAALVLIKKKENEEA